ncbi:STAS domain-containing protein [Gilvimarinus chinensis]|uniref:STAS domain-containing protein n=1 Tax=Gilvimarinus chinensis TaxID=396005 RepID=UPI00037B3AEF|nr:STAS domain-containing protein [Gilvimarinus chinensis]
MRPGQILVADHDGVFVIKMLGDVRLTLCISFDNFIDDMFARSDFAGVLFDLSEAEAIDSTTLGLMAKISILGGERVNSRPVIYSTNPSINRILETMGFADIFTIVDELQRPVPAAQPLSATENNDEETVKAKVIEAHRILMGLNQENQKTFTNLINMLEGDQ